MAGEGSAPPPAKIFSCPSCGAAVSIRAQGLTVSVVCSACGAVLDAHDENFKILTTVAQKLKVQPLIPLGQRSRFRGVVWEVIGFMERVDGSGAYSWREYLLFNPFQGFRWLTEFDGHWNYVVQIKDQPVEDSSSAIGSYGRKIAKVLGKSYFLFQKGSAKVVYVVGEFYWRVTQNERVEVVDYIRVPEILTGERTKDEVTWSIGEYVPASEVKTAFQITSPMPIQTGVAPNQTGMTSSLAPAIQNSWAMLLVLLGAIQLMSLNSKKQLIYQGDFSYNAQDSSQQKVTPAFELKGGTKNLEIALTSPVSNTWLEVQGDLVDDLTGETYDFEEGVEYYSGVDSDGSWTEGSRSTDKVLSSIPDGTYHLNFEVSAAKDAFFVQNRHPYHLQVTRDVTTWSNFLLALLAISIFPLLVMWRAHRFEQARWSTSDFSPYQQEED